MFLGGNMLDIKHIHSSVKEVDDSNMYELKLIL